jgi:hypothetical protein
VLVYCDSPVSRLLIGSASQLKFGALVAATPSRKRKLESDPLPDKQLSALASASTDTRTDISKVSMSIGTVNKEVMRLTTIVYDLERYIFLLPVYSVPLS